MIDREKVVGHLYDCLAASRLENTWVFVRKDIVGDAITLLKEQEAVEPIPPTDESDLWKCGNCNHQLFRCTHQRYCDMCGKEVKWE